MRNTRAGTTTIDRRPGGPRRPWPVRLSAWLGQRWCGLTTGHYYVRVAEDRRVVLRCFSCDHASPGWSVEGRGDRA